MKMKKIWMRSASKPISALLALLLLFSVALVPAQAEGDLASSEEFYDLTAEPSYQNAEIFGSSESGAYDPASETLESAAEAFEPAMSSSDPVIVVSLGDSYSSGEGNEPFYGQNGDRYNSQNWVAHRSSVGWGSKLMIPISDDQYSETMASYHTDVYQDSADTSSSPSEYQWYFVAASGAVTADLYGLQKKENKKPDCKKVVYLYPQAQIFDEIQGRGTIDYVTFTMGGNDLGFAKILTDVVLMPNYLGYSSIDAMIDAAWAKYNSITKYSLMEYYWTVMNYAPDADILVVGYPELLHPDGAGVNKHEADAVNKAAREFNAKLEGLVESIGSSKIHFVDVAAKFSGHGAYSPNGEWIHPLLVPFYQDISDKNPASSYSFHPNGTGSAIYAECVNAKIKEIEERKHQGTLSGKICKASDRTSAIPNAIITTAKAGAPTKRWTLSDGTGNYSIKRWEGDYLVTISANGYIDFTAYASVTARGNTYMETFLLVQGNPGETGTAAGTVSNAMTGVGINGVELRVRNGWNNTSVGEVLETTTTDDEGSYSLTLPLGNYTVEAVLDGYVTSSFNIIVQGGTTAGQNGTMMPVLQGDSYRIVLTWGENPSDLDSHVVGTRSDGEPFHVYYGNKDAYDGDIWVCNLDVDDVTSYGPETITLNTTNATPYYYYIYRYAGNGTVADSGAQIKVYQGESLITTFNVPTDQGPDDYWNVFAIVNGRLVIRNTITDYPDMDYANTRRDPSLAGFAAMAKGPKDTDDPLDKEADDPTETTDEELPVEEPAPSEETPPKEDADPGDELPPDALDGKEKDDSDLPSEPADEPESSQSGADESGAPGEPADEPEPSQGGDEEGGAPAEPAVESAPSEDGADESSVPDEPSEDDPTLEPGVPDDGGPAE